MHVKIPAFPVAAAIAAAMSLTAFAQNSPRFRTPRRAVLGPIQSQFRREAATPTSATFNTDQGPGPGPIGPGPGCDVFPAPASIGTAVSLSYFGPPPSTVNQSLVGPVQLLNTGPIDTASGTVTIPLYISDT
jgi:hypothetical protein